MVDRALEIEPESLALWSWKLNALLGQGDLEEARREVSAAMERIDPTSVVIYTAFYGERFWVLTDEQQLLLLQQTPRAFDGDLADWGLTLAHTSYVRGDLDEARRYARGAAEAYAAQRRDAEESGSVPAWFDAFEGVAWAYAGEREKALANASRLEGRLVAEADSSSGPYYRHQLARLYLLLGELELALDEIEKILAVPYTFSIAWMEIDPLFEPLRDHPRYRELAEKYG